MEHIKFSDLQEYDLVKFKNGIIAIMMSGTNKIVGLKPYFKSCNRTMSYNTKRYNEDGVYNVYSTRYESRNPHSEEWNIVEMARPKFGVARRINLIMGLTVEDKIIWKPLGSQKVEVVIDGQVLHLSRESVEELKKLIKRC